VVVAELVPAVVHWNRGFLAHLADSPLDDNRVTIHESDVAEMIKTARGSYNAILLDVDNGPQALTLKDNDWLYSLGGLETAFAALQPKGVLAIWSSGSDAAFAKRLGQAGFDVDEVRVRGRVGGKAAQNMVWIAIRI
jgi:spermidine synthase